MSVKEYEQYARNVDRLVEKNRNLNRTHMTIKELEEKIESPPVPIISTFPFNSFFCPLTPTSCKIMCLE